MDKFISLFIEKTEHGTYLTRATFLSEEKGKQFTVAESIESPNFLVSIEQLLIQRKNHKDYSPTPRLDEEQPGE